MNVADIKKNLKRKLDETRYEHTLGVASTAACLAMRYEADLDRAYLAGLLHDCAKYGKDAKKLEHCIEYGIAVTEAERRNPSLLHAKLGAYYAENRYGVADGDILSAIACHTTGKPDMTLLEKIIFTADYIEPNRDKAPHLKRLRMLAFTDLDLCVYEILRDTLSYLNGKHASVDPTTEQVFRFYEQKAHGKD